MALEHCPFIKSPDGSQPIVPVTGAALNFLRVPPLLGQQSDPDMKQTVLSLLRLG